MIWNTNTKKLFSFKNNSAYKGLRVHMQVHYIELSYHHESVNIRSLMKTTAHIGSWHYLGHILWVVILQTGLGPGLNIKTIFPRHGDSHVKDMMVTRPSYLYHGDPHAVKMTSLYWDGPLIPWVKWKSESCLKLCPYGYKHLCHLAGIDLQHHFCDYRGKNVDNRAFLTWSLNHGSSWSSLIKAGPGSHCWDYYPGTLSSVLTHWGWVMHKCVSKVTIIG